MPPKRKREGAAASIFDHVKSAHWGLSCRDGNRLWLEQRCARWFGCDERAAKRMVDEYERFLAIKLHERDFRAGACSPPDAIDAVWRAHVLDTERYALDCFEATGLEHEVFVYRPDDDADEDLRTRRRAHTLALYEKLFGQKPGVLWMGDKNEEDGEQQAEEKSSRMVFQVSATNGRRITVGGRPSDSIRFIKNQIRAFWQVPPQHQMLCYGGEELEDHRSLRDCAIVSYGIVYMVRTDIGGC